TRLFLSYARGDDEPFVERLWSVYLLTIERANRPGPGSPLAIGIAGLGAAITTASGSGGRHAGNGAGGRWSWSVACWSGAIGLGVTGAEGSAGWGPGCGASMASGSWLGCTCCPGTCARCLLQHGQTYLWTKCSTANSDADR